MIIATFTIIFLDGVSWRHIPSTPYSVQLEAFRLDVRLDVQILVFIFLFGIVILYFSNMLLLNLMALQFMFPHIFMRYYAVYRYRYQS